MFSLIATGRVIKTPIVFIMNSSTMEALANIQRNEQKYIYYITFEKKKFICLSKSAYCLCLLV